MIYAGIPDERGFGGSGGGIRYLVPTAHTLAIPAPWLKAIIEGIDKIPQFAQEDMTKAETTDGMIAKAREQGNLVRMSPRQPLPGIEPIRPGDIEREGV